MLLLVSDICYYTSSLLGISDLETAASMTMGRIPHKITREFV